MSCVKYLMRHKAIASIVAVAFLLHALMPFFAVYQLPDTRHTSAKEMASLFGDKVLVCTEDGFKLVRWEDVLSGKEHPKPHTQYQCPLCYVAAHGQAVPPNAAFFMHVPSPTAHEVSVPHHATMHVREWRWRRFLTRSPPASLTA
jgi:hypothetical protein